MTVHRCPVDDILPCCGQYIFMVPRTDRILSSASTEPATCGAPHEPVSQRDHVLANIKASREIRHRRQGVAFFRHGPGRPILDEHIKAAVEEHRRRVDERIWGDGVLEQIEVRGILPGGPLAEL